MIGELRSHIPNGMANDNNNVPVIKKKKKHMHYSNFLKQRITLFFNFFFKLHVSIIFFSEIELLLALGKINISDNSLKF